MKSYAQKIQALLVSHLLDQGSINLRLPDGVTIEIDITKAGKYGDEITQNYCSVKSSREDKSVTLDTYNLSMQYPDEESTVVCMDNLLGDRGQSVRRYEVI